MQVVCEHCGRRFEAQRSTAKFCSDQHRKAAAKARKRPRNVVPMARPVEAGTRRKRLTVVDSTPDDVLAPPTERPTPGSDVYDIVDAIKSRYRTQLHTPSGQLALKLARIIDGGKPDGSVASEARELRQVLLTLDAVVAANDEEDDPVSRARRRHHGS